MSSIPELKPPALRATRMRLHAQHQPIALMRADCHVCRSEGLASRSQVLITSNGHEVQAQLYQIDSDLLALDEVALSEEAWDALGIRDGDSVHVRHPPVLESLAGVRQRIYGRRLGEEDLAAIVRDVVRGRYTDVHLSAFLTATATLPLSIDETIFLTKAMVEVGDRLSWQAPIVVDKHCVGGLPGNRTTPLVVAIAAANGLVMPKTSSRAITSPSGTADTMEVLANVDLCADHMRAIVAREKAVLAWGGRVNLSPADDVLISVERPLRIDTFEQMVASILSKKLAAGSTHLVLDIPVGPTAKVRSQSEAVRLRKLFEYISSKLGMEIDVVVTDGSQPIGRGIGPVLEARDVMAVLRGDADAPEDLRDRALLLAGHVLDFDPALKGGRGFARAMELLASGAALAAMERLIDAQGRQPVALRPGPFTHEVCAPHEGRIVAIDCHVIARIARLAGAPMDKGAGIDLLHKVGAQVRKGEALYRIHAQSHTGLDFARELAVEDCGYEVAR